MVFRGGQVKFEGEESWVVDGSKLPKKFVRGLYLNAIDLQGAPFYYEALDNLIELRRLRHLSLRGCPYVDDW